jgi:hypothetical protein
MLISLDDDDDDESKKEEDCFLDDVAYLSGDSTLFQH